MLNLSPVTIDGTIGFFSNIIVRAPGQKKLISLLAFSVIKASSSAISNPETIKGRA
jgi:hypothetical protein